MFMRHLCLVLAFFWQADACVADPAAAAKQFQENFSPSQVVSVLGGWQGSDTAVTNPSVERVMDQAAWTTLWSRHDPLHTAPKVDFSRAMVVAIFTGSVSGSVYGIHLDSVIENAGQMELTSGLFISDVIRQELVNLYLFVELPRSSKPITVVQHSFGIMMSPQSRYDMLAELPEIH